MTSSVSCLFAKVKEYLLPYNTKTYFNPQGCHGRLGSTNCFWFLLGEWLRVMEQPFCLLETRPFFRDLPYAARFFQGHFKKTGQLPAYYQSLPSLYQELGARQANFHPRARFSPRRFQEVTFPIQVMSGLTYVYMGPFSLNGLIGS